MTSQNKTGPENLPLKAVIALMGAAATLSRLAKDPRTGFISPFLSEQLKGGAQRISHHVQCLKAVCGFYSGVILHTVAVLMLSI